MNIQLGLLFVAAGLFFHLSRRLGFFNRRPFYRLVPNFLIANGIGLFIPLPAYQDGLGLALMAFLGDELWHYRQNLARFWKRCQDDWDRLRGM